jgi:sugar-specific transcriptional regulator TrmB
MSQNQVITDLEEFLKSLGLSNYEIRGYLALLKTEYLTAKDLGRKAKIPIGRIYDVLEKLNETGMVEIQESHPKLYKAVSPNLTFQNVINHFKDENRRRVESYMNQAKLLEAKIAQSNLWFKEESPGIFWSTAFGTPAVMNLYTKKLDELQEELLMTGFLNKATLKILPYGKDLFLGLFHALKRGVNLKMLWSFEFDSRPLIDSQKSELYSLYREFQKRIGELFGLSSEIEGLEMKFLFRKFPTYYDVFDRKRVVIKLQNPVKSAQFFACLNVLDLHLAKELRDKFLDIWTFEAEELKIKN